MPLRFRSFVSYTLPGVLALIGWWWYISRKKERITSHDSEEGSVMGLRGSSGEGSNGMVDKSYPAASSTHHRTSRDRVKEYRPVEQEVVAEIHMPVLKATAGEALSTPPVVLASGKLSASQSSTKSVPLQSHPETTTPVSSSTPTKTVDESTHHKGPEAAIGSKPSSQLPPDLVSTGSVKKQVENQPLTKQHPAELAKAVRPEPEGEVATETSAPTCNQNLPADISKDELASATSSAEGEAVLLETCSPKTPLTLTSFPNSTSTPLSESATEAQHHENGDLGLPAETSPDIQELQRLAAGLITQVISAATQEVMAVSSQYSKGSEAADSSTPAVNGKEVGSYVPLESMESSESRAEQIAEEIVNGSDVNSMDSVDSCSTLGVGDSQPSGSQTCQSQSSELIVWEIEVPKHLVGRLIGKQGRYVSFLKQSSGAKIYISTLPYTQEFQICHIEGTQQQVDKALALIEKKFKDLDLTNLYAPPPPPLTLPSLPMTSWLLLPNGVTVEVIVVNIVSAGHLFVQQHTHPTYHALRSLDQQMFLCYSQPGTPPLPSPVEVGVICAAPAVDGAWWRAQVISFYKDSTEVEIRYVDYGGYDRVKIDTLRQIRSDFVTLPFQGTEVLLDNIAPLPGEDRFSAEANSALEEMTRGVPLLAQVTNYDNNTGLPLVHMWNMVGEELVLLNRTLAEAPSPSSPHSPRGPPAP
uniref:A kinase (PRKA) anchor protein 1b n=1 Tax=Cyprinus carpio TaxID=7962 RepID=A0A8C1ZHM8_CYPCA